MNKYVLGGLITRAKISTFRFKISQSLKEYIWAAFAVLFLKKIA